MSNELRNMESSATDASWKNAFKLAFVKSPHLFGVFGAVVLMAAFQVAGVVGADPKTVAGVVGADPKTVLEEAKGKPHTYVDYDPVTGRRTESFESPQLSTFLTFDPPIQRRINIYDDGVDNPALQIDGLCSVLSTNKVVRYVNLPTTLEITCKTGSKESKHVLEVNSTQHYFVEGPPVRDGQKMIRLDSPLAVRQYCDRTRSPGASRAIGAHGMSC